MHPGPKGPITGFLKYFCQIIGQKIIGDFDSNNCYIGRQQTRIIGFQEKRHIFAQNWRKLAKIGENWRKLAKIGENWRKRAKKRSSH
jgi:hypothetical protein